MTKQAVMFQGTGSHVGKSTIVAGLARLLTRRGLAVRPFKPLNMSNNAAVTADGGEIGRAQALQARAARIPATVDMNPILLKPQSGGRAQLVVHGHRRASDSDTSGDGQVSLLPEVLHSFARVSAGADIVLVEGAGSSAELNLRSGDVANMGFAAAADVPVVLIGDIDRGGVIASIVGTLTVLAQSDRKRVQAFLINKLHGNTALFADGIHEIETRGNIPCVGVIPYTSVAEQLPAEDGVAFSNPRTEKRLATGSAIRIAVLQLPTIANFDDLDPLIAEPDVDLVHVTPGAAIPGDLDLVVLPGTKSTLADLEFIRGQGWDIDLTAHWRRGGHMLGICGGYQLLGQRVADPAGIEGPCGEADGLGFLEITTELETRKTLGEARGHHIPSGAAVGGYEIHLGRTTGPDCDRPMLSLDGRNGGAMSADGRVQGCYLHGLFAADAFRHAYLNRLRPRDESGLNFDQSIDAALDALADHLDGHLDIDAILRIADRR